MSTSGNPTLQMTVDEAAASPWAMAFEEPRPILEQRDSFSYVQPAASIRTPASGVKRSMSRQEWEDVKPLIEREYIDEKKPFHHVAYILRSEHGFEPTKRQFSRKVEEWGLRKNVSQSERRQILQSLDGEPDQVITVIEDRRVGYGKLENWRKRYRKEANIGGFLRTQHTSLAAPECQAFPTKTKTQEVMMSTSATEDVSELTSIFEHRHASSRIEDLDALSRCPELMDCDVWSVKWTDVDVTRSPGLSHFYDALEIEFALPIPPLCLDIQNSEESQYISDTELLGLWNRDNKTLADKFDVSFSPKQLDLTHASRKIQTQSSPCRDPKLVFYQWRESPLNEICVFPTFPTKAGYQPPSSTHPLCVRLETQAAELRIRICKLKPLWGMEHPRIIAMMEYLAETYISQGNYREAEKLCRRVANATRRISGRTDLKTLASYQKWIRSLIHHGQFQHAQTILNKMHSTISKLVSHDHAIATEATFLMAWTAMNLENYEKAEEMLRQLLQIQLITLGPRNYGTRLSMDFLGSALRKRNKNSEAEKLLRTVLQLHSEFEEIRGEYSCDTMDELSFTLLCQDLNEESEDVARRAIERFEASLGQEHPMILNTRVQFARSIAVQGRYLESEPIFQNVLKQHSKLLGESHPYTLATVYLLAINLEEMDRLDEAATLYEKSFWGKLDVYGPNSNSTVNSCYRLGQCYEDQKRFNDALKLYGQLVQRIQAVEGNNDQLIAEVQGWIESVQNRLLDREENMSSEDTNTISEEGSEGNEEETAENL